MQQRGQVGCGGSCAGECVSLGIYASLPSKQTNLLGIFISILQRRRLKPTKGEFC